MFTIFVHRLQNFLMLCWYIFLLKLCKQLLQKYLLFLFFVLLNINQSKIFDVHIMWFIFIRYKQWVHWIFKFLFWNLNRICQFVFITKNTDTNFVSQFNFSKIIFWYMKFNSFIIKIINHFFIFLCYSFRMYFYQIIFQDVFLPD